MRKWLEWVRAMGSPKRFCSLDTSKCYFRPEDCALILLVGMSVGEQTVALSVCPPADAIGFFLPASPIPKVDDVFRLYDGAAKLYLEAGKALNDIQNKLGIDILPIDPLPPLPNLENTKAQAKNVVDNIQNLQDMLLPSTPGAAAATYFFASAIVAANAGVAGLGQPAGMAASARHLAAAAILLLRKYNVSDPALELAAQKLWTQEQDNAFFAFLASDRSAKVDELIRASCPYVPNSTAARFQWVWERSVSVDASAETMYWDCIFAADLALNGVKYTTGAFAGARLTDLIPPIARSWNNVKTAAEDVENIVKAVADERGRLLDTEKTFRDKLAYLNRVLPAVIDKSIPHVNGDGSVTLPAPPGVLAPSATIGGKKGVTISIGKHCLIGC